MRNIFILLVFLINLQAYDILELLDKDAYINSASYGDSILTLSIANTIFKIDIKSKKIVAKQTYPSLILDIKDDKAITKKDLNFNTKFGEISSPSSYENSKISIFYKNTELIALDTNQSDFSLNSRVKPITSYIYKDEIYISFFDKTLAKFTKNLKLLDSNKNQNLISSILKTDTALYLGDNKGNLTNGIKQVSIPYQIDFICKCWDSICVGDYRGNFYVFDENLNKKEYEKQIFKERVRALFYDNEVGVIAISWNGDIAIIDNIKEF